MEPHYTQGGQKVNSRTELLHKRKLEKIPDKTYDLDGDGFVGGRDYVISKRFDVDKDGKLNEKERRNAYEAIKNNVEDQYIWNLENQGANDDDLYTGNAENQGRRPCRIIQKVSNYLFII